MVPWLVQESSVFREVIQLIILALWVVREVPVGLVEQEINQTLNNIVGWTFALHVDTHFNQG